MVWDKGKISDRSSKPFAAGKFSNEVVVHDVIINEEHPDYSGANIGRISAKNPEHGATPRGAVILAYPKYADDFQTYPLIGESVFIELGTNRDYYTRRIAKKAGRLQYNKQRGSTTRLRRSNTTRQSIEENSLGVQAYAGEEPQALVTHEKYEPIEHVHTLKHFEGDVILQNRYGATLRFGSSQSELALNQETVFKELISGSGLGEYVLGPTKEKGLTTPNNAPIIVMRVGERPHATTTRFGAHGLVVEDINLDSSSLVLAANQNIKFKFAANSTYFRSSQRLTNKEYPLRTDDLTSLLGNQSILNSGRVVLNSKTEDVIFSSNRNLISLTNEDTILDTGRDFVIGAQKIYFLKNSTSPLIIEAVEGDPRSWSNPHGVVMDENGELSAANDPLAYADSAALAREVIDVFKKLIAALTNPGAYQIEGGRGIIDATQLGERLSDIDLTKIKSELVRIEK